MVDTDSSKRKLKRVNKLGIKERRVLEALEGGKELRWCDMSDAIGYITLKKMVQAGLIEQIPNGVSAGSKDARWRLMRRSPQLR